MQPKVMASLRPKQVATFLFTTQVLTKRGFVEQDQTVEFELEEGKKGPQAVKVEVIG